jgi:Transaldolase/Fructose-6-phosphate aldolase
MKRRLAGGRWRRRHGCGATIDLVSALSSCRGTSSPRLTRPFLQYCRFGRQGQANRCGLQTTWYRPRACSHQACIYLGRYPGCGDPPARGGDVQYDVAPEPRSGSCQCGGRRIPHLPFVGRIHDWYKKSSGSDFSVDEDPGVRSVREIYSYYKNSGMKTIVMGASFRSTAQIEALAGCDRLTISPAPLDELSAADGKLDRVLSPDIQSRAALHQPEDTICHWFVGED